MRSINRHSVSISVFVVAMVLLSAGSAFALDMEYYTYNGFDAIMGAFQKVALIFSDNGYKTLFFSVMVLGILIGALGMVVRVINGKFSPAAWAAPIGIGFIIYMCLIIPKATLHIYDPVKNRSQAVGDLPQGIVFVAGMLNLLERGLVDIVSTSGSPEGYDTQAGGVGFDMILNMGLKGIQLEDKTIHASLQKYTEDCLMFEMTRPGTVLNVNNVAKNKDFMSVYAEGQNPAAYTVYYNPSGGDETMTCTEAWNRLQAQLSSQSNFLASRKERCAAAGFDPTNPTEMNQCIGTIENTMAWLQGESYGINAIDQQTLLANTLAEAFAFYSPEAAARIYGSRNIGSSMVGSGIMANSWIPIIRAVITAIAIGLVPFMVIFIPTPLAGRAVGIIAGFFVWLTAWGVTDAIIHQFAMDYGKKVFEEVSRYQLGLAAVMNFTTAGAKTMAAFGAIRWTGIMLATVITGTLIKFGGTAMAHLSGQLTGSASSMGQSAGMKAMTPEGKANAISQFEAAPSVMANAHRFTFMDRADVHTMERMGKTKYGNEMTGGFGGVEGASDLIAAGHTGRGVRFGAAGLAIQNGPGGARGGLDRHLFDSRANEFALGNMQNIYGNDSQGLANRKTAAEETFVNMAKERGMNAADLQKGFSQLDFGSTMSFIDKYAQKTGQGFTAAAKDLGEIAGSQRYAGAAGYENARGVVGEEGMVFTGTNKHLNEAGKFEMTYQLANGLGIAKSREDFTGMYQHHKMHHGEDGLTLTDQKAVNTLNDRMRSMGYNTRFQTGDRIRMNFDDKGNIVSAYATRGASRDSRDITTEMKGYHGQFLNLTESRTGFRGEHGSSTVNLDRVATDNYTYKDKDGMIYHGQMVQYGNGTGQFSGTVIDGQGNKHAGAATFFEGKPVNTTFQNGKTGEIVEKVQVPTGKTGTNGKPEYTEQWSASKVVLSPQGHRVIHDKRSLSHEEVEKNGYAAHKTVNTQTGTTLHETDKKGQNVLSEQKFTIDNKSNFHGNPQSTIAGYSTDYTALSDSQVAGIMAVDMIGDGIGMYGRFGQLRSAHESFSNSLGKSSGETKLNILKRPRGTGNMSSHPAAGSPAKNLSPSRINQTYTPQE